LKIIIMWKDLCCKFTYIIYTIFSNIKKLAKEYSTMMPFGKLKLILILAAILSNSVKTFPATIIEFGNNSFEAKLSFWSVNSAGANTDYSPDESISHTGRYSAKITCRAATSKAFIWQASPEEKRVIGGESYTFWVWVKTENVRKASDVGSNSHGAALCISWGDLYFEEFYRADWVEGPTGTHDWVRISTTVVAPAKAERVRVELHLNLAEGTVWFDDVNCGDITPPPAPSLISPRNDSVVVSLPITFDWADVEDVDNQSPPVIYELQIDDNEDFLSPVVNSQNLTSSEYTTSLSDGVYWWRVRARDGAANYSNWTSPPWIVRVNVTNSSAPIVLQLQNGGFESGLAYWTKHTTSAIYSIDTSVAHSGMRSAKIQSNSFVEAYIWQATDANSIIPGQSYRFWVWLKTEDVVKGTAASHGAALRILWGDNFFQTTYRNDWVEGSTGTTHWAKLEATLVAPAGAERAQVALFLHNATGTVWFDDVNTEIVYIDTAPPPTPYLISPHDNSIITSLPINFDWADVSDLSPPVKYDLQVDDSVDFLSPEVNLANLTTSSYTLFSLPNGTYWWRVRAKDSLNNRSAWALPYKLIVNVSLPFSIEDIMEVRPNFVVKNATIADKISLKYYVAASGKVRIRVYSLSGRLVKEIVNKYKDVGVYEDVWDMRDENGVEIPSGVYFVHYFLSGTTQKVEKVIYVK
jgi:hypothetical protein